MSATIHEETMTVSRSTIVDLIAALQAAADLVGGGFEENKRFSRELLSDAISGMAVQFRVALLGPPPEGDDEYATDPTLVETDARAAEFEAEMIAGLMKSRVSAAQTRAQLEARDGREAQLREHAKRIRAAGNIDVGFPTSGELLERLRLEMNAAIEERGDDVS